jgi:hypothetical protein
MPFLLEREGSFTDLSGSNSNRSSREMIYCDRLQFLPFICFFSERTDSMDVVVQANGSLMESVAAQPSEFCKLL